MYRILIFIFFSRKTVSNTSPEGILPRICRELIPSIQLHNLGKTAVTKKVHFQDRWERNAHNKRFTLHQFIKQNNQNNIINFPVPVLFQI